MSSEINKSFVQQYTDNLIILAQQQGSKLMSAVRKETVTGKSAYFDRLGPTEAQVKTTRHTPTPQVDTPHSRRKVNLVDYHVADLIDRQDEVRMLIDPKSAYAQSMAWSLGRQMDDFIIDAADGNSISVDSADATTNVAVAHVVDEDFGSGTNSDITLAKIIEARRILLGNEVNMSQPLYFVLDAVSLGTLLNDTTLTSADYNSVKALVSGEINSFVGFNFLHSERLNNSSEGFKNSLAFAKNSIVYASGKDTEVRITERDDMSYATQVYACMTGGAVRLDEDGVVVVEAYRA